MQMRGRLPFEFLRLTTRHFRRIVIASAVTLLISLLLMGLVGVMRWRGREALHTDTDVVTSRVGQLLIRTLQSRRGTLTFIRDTLNRRADLTSPQLEAMGKSAVEHTRHLLGIGLIRATTPTTWWSVPYDLSKSQLVELNRAILRRAALRGVWRVPSTFIAFASPQRPLLIMFEPLRAMAYRESAIVGVFDLGSLVMDFFTSSAAAPYPVRLLDGDVVLYASEHWKLPRQDEPPLLVEYPVRMDAARWMLQMQPGTTHVAKTLSWFSMLLVVLCIIAGLGMTALVWLLTARAWILQRAVARRTDALRRTSQRLRQLAVTDELTGLYNRRFFLDRWEWEWARAKRYQRPLACVMIDVNGFKQVNDQLGHHTGDLILKQVAQELRTLLRESDILARFGGDEFVIALPETSPEQAAAVAEKLRHIRIPLPTTQERLQPISLSVGMGRFEQPDESSQAILQAADESLYAFKRRLHRLSEHV